MSAKRCLPRQLHSPSYQTPEHRHLGVLPRASRTSGQSPNHRRQHSLLLHPCDYQYSCDILSNFHTRTRHLRQQCSCALHDGEIVSDILPSFLPTPRSVVHHLRRHFTWHPSSAQEWSMRRKGLHSGAPTQGQLPTARRITRSEWLAPRTQTRVTKRHAETTCPLATRLCRSFQSSTTLVHGQDTYPGKSLAATYSSKPATLPPFALPSRTLGKSWETRAECHTWTFYRRS